MMDMDHKTISFFIDDRHLSKWTIPEAVLSTGKVHAFVESWDEGD